MKHWVQNNVQNQSLAHCKDLFWLGKLFRYGFFSKTVLRTLPRVEFIGTEWFPIPWKIYALLRWEKKVQVFLPLQDISSSWLHKRNRQLLKGSYAKPLVLFKRFNLSPFLQHHWQPLSPFAILGCVHSLPRIFIPIKIHWWRTVTPAAIERTSLAELVALNLLNIARTV